MKAKRHDAKEGEHHVFFADIKRSGNTSVFVNGLEHIQGFQDGQELCDAAGKEDNADDFKNLIQGGPIFKGQAGMNLHGCFRSRCHSNGHNDEFAIFPRDLNIFFVAVYILLEEHFYKGGIIAHGSMGIHDLAAAGFLQFLEKSTGSLQFFFIRLFHSSTSSLVRASSPAAVLAFSRPGAIRLPGLEKSGSFPFSANLESSASIFPGGIPYRPRQ